MDGLRDKKDYFLKNLLDSEFSGFKKARAYSDWIDRFLRVSLKKAPEHHLVVLATGGYGRRELFPRADIDLVFLHEKPLPSREKKIAEGLLYPLWDAGEQVGHTTLQLSACRRLCIKDPRMFTSLLESRRLTGDPEIYRKFRLSIASLLRYKTPGYWIQKKISEWKKRHDAWDKEIGRLEPDLKESPGGLRDYHTLIWLNQLRFGRRSIFLLVQKKWLTRTEYENLYTSVDFLMSVRFHLHCLRKSRSNVLVIDAQRSLAGDFFGGKLYPGEDPSERFLGKLNRSLSCIQHLTHRLIRKLSQTGGARKSTPFVFPKGVEPFGSFTLTRQKELDLKTSSVSSSQASNPSFLCRFFQLLQKTGLSLDVSLETWLEKKIQSLDPLKKIPKESYNIFISILSEKKHVYLTLEKMRNLGFFSHLFPEFNRLQGHIKHDAYHQYSTDHHTFLLLHHLESLSSDFSASRVLQQEIFLEMKQKWVLYLAALFHDIGKGEGSGHVEKGRKIFESISRRMGLKKNVFSRVDFLIASHLLMNHTAQRRNLEDARTIINFADRVGSRENLDALFLLTYADLLSVAPDVWNEWKASLLNDLYIKSRRYLEGLPPLLRISDAEVDDLRERLALEATDTTEQKRMFHFFSSIGKDYFSRMTPKKIRLHLRSLHLLKSSPVVLNLTHHPNRGFTELLVVTKNREKLFSNISGLLAIQRINILKADIFTTLDNIALDIFRVSTTASTPVYNSRKWDRFKQGMIDILENRGSFSDRFIIPPEKNIHGNKKSHVRFIHDASDQQTLLEITTSDRVGLLYRVSSVLSAERINIHSAIIDTHRDHVHDIFYLTSIQDLKKLSLPVCERLKKLILIKL